jgi:hypothetical protein
MNRGNRWNASLTAFILLGFFEPMVTIMASPGLRWVGRIARGTLPRSVLTRYHGPDKAAR